MLDRRGFIKALTGAMAAASIAPASIIPLPPEELRALPVSASLVIPADCHFLIHDVNFMNIGKHVAAPRLRIFDELINLNGCDRYRRQNGIKKIIVRRITG